MAHLESLVCPFCKEPFFYDGSAAGAEMSCPNCRRRFVLPGTQPPQGVVHDESLGLVYDIGGQHPVQAEGRIQGHPFYFRAKWNFWDFTVCVSDDNIELPGWMSPPEDKPGFFRDMQQEGYYLSEYFGEGNDASEMALEVADRIIRECVARFLRAMHERKTGETRD